MAAATPAMPAAGISTPAVADSSHTSKDRWGYSVIVAIILFVAGPIVVGGSTPDTSDGAQKILRFYTDHSGQQTVAGAGAVLAAVAFIVFACTLLRSLRRVNGTDSQWPWLAFAGGLVMGLGLMIAGGMHIMLAQDAKHLSAPAAQAVNSVEGAPWIAVIGGLGLMALGAIAATWHARAIPRWYAIVGIVLAIGTMTPVGWIVGLGTLLWLLALGVMMATRGLPAPHRV